MNRLDSGWMTTSTQQLYNALSDDCEVEAVLSRFYAQTAQDAVLARVYHRLQFHGNSRRFAGSLTPSEVRSAIAQEAMDCETDHFLAGSDIPSDDCAPAPLHAALRDQLLQTFTHCSLHTLLDFDDLRTRDDEDADDVPMSVTWSPDSMCELLAKHCSPRTSCSSGTDSSHIRQLSGLRPLASRVLEIVQSSFTNATYHSVSEVLLSEIEPCTPEVRLKTVKNVRRRIYDAINVMVAVGIFKRDGDCISVSHPRSSGERRTLRSQLERKKAKLRALASTYQLLHNLCQRNQRDHAPPADRLPLPFLVLATPDRTDVSVRHTQIRIATDACNQFVRVKTSTQVTLLGDLNALQRLRLPRFLSLPSAVTALCE